MVNVIESKNLEELGYGGKPKVVKEKDPEEKPKGKVLMSKTGDLDENFYLR